MARGIITIKPGTGGTTAGKIMVTDGAGSADGTTPSLSLGIGVNFTESTTANVGDLVSFDLNSTGLASKIVLAIQGKLINNSGENVLVSSGQHVAISGTIDGKVTVAGGVLAVLEKTKVGGRLESSTDNSFIFSNGADIAAKVEFSGAGYLFLENTIVEGKVSSDGSVYTMVKKCTINGSLEVINTVDCHCNDNTVDGKTNTPNNKP